MDVDVEFGFGPFSRDCPRMSVLLDPSLWRTSRSKKDLNPELLRWFLLLYQFDFEVRDEE